MTLEELFELAQQYGNVSIYQSDKDRGFSATIKFMTIEHMELEAQSGFHHATVREALVAAIHKAQEIVVSLKRTAKQLGI